MHPGKAHAHAVVGVDIGATKTALMVFDWNEQRVLGERRFTTPVSAGPDRLLGAVGGELDALLAEHGRNRAELGALGVAVPGRVDHTGHVILAGKLAGWSNVPLRTRLERELGIPVFVEQDANAAALGEHWRGCAQKLKNFVFLALGTGIGAGLFLDGRLYRGAHHAAGELGDAILDRGALEHAGRRHRNLGKLIGGRKIRALAQLVSGRRLSAAQAIAHARHDPRLETVAQHVVDYTALATIAVASLLDPEAIVFGGGTSVAGAALLDRVRSRIAAQLSHEPRLLASELGESAQLYGAVIGAARARGAGH